MEGFSFRNLMVLTGLFCLALSMTAIAQSPNYPTGFSVSATSNTSIQVQWTSATTGTVPTGYLILAIKTDAPAGTYATVADGTPVADDLDFSGSTKNAAINVGYIGAGTVHTYTFTGLDAQTPYEFRIHPYSGAGATINYRTTAAPTSSAWTLATEPSSYPASFTSTVINAGRVDHSFSAANTIANADGYLLLKKIGSAPDATGIVDGVAPGALSLPSGTILVTTISDATATSYQNNGTLGGTHYYYILVPFNFNGSNSETYNYKTDGAIPETDVTTPTASVTITQIAGAGSSIAPNPLSSGSSDQAILGFSISSDAQVNFNSVNILASDPDTKFSNVRLFESSDAVYGSDSDVGASVVVTSSEIQINSIGQTITPLVQHFFVVADVDASLNAATPSVQLSFTEVHVGVSSGSVNNVTITGINYSFADGTPPQIAFTPANGATNVPVTSNIVITFNEPIRNIDNTPLSAADLQALVELKETNDAGADIPFSASIDGTNQIITINPTPTLNGNQMYFVEVNALVEDTNNNAVTAESITFQTELPPSITSFTPTARCIGDDITITGLRFGTTNQPTVFVNGTAVPSANVSSFTNTQIIFTIPPSASTGTITVQNNDNGLMSATSASTLTVHPAIDVAAPATPATTNPSLNTSVDITVGSPQSSISYALILTSYSGPGTVSTGTKAVDNAAPIILNTGTLAATGEYSYKITASRAGCSTKDLNNTVILHVAELVADAGNDIAICQGSSTKIGGDPTALGGTGFYSFSWSGPSGFTSSNPNPTVTMSGTYTVTVSDNSGASDTDDVIVTVNPNPVVQFEPSGSDLSVRTSFSNQDNPYLLNASATPADGTGVFSGIAVSLHPDNNYYFDPQAAGIQNNLTITYTHTNVTGCSQSTNLTVNVFDGSTLINNFRTSYCTNGSYTGAGNLLSVNPSRLSSGYSFSHFVYFDPVNGYAYLGDAVFPLLPDPAPASPPRFQIDINKIATNLGGTNSFFYLGVYETNGVTTTFIGWQSANVYYPGAVPPVSFDKFVCADAQPIALVSLPNSTYPYTTLNYTVNDGPDNSISLSGGVFEFDPSEITFSSGADVRPLILTHHYTDNNGCSGSTSVDFNTVRKPDLPVAEDEQYCQGFNGKLTLAASGSYGDFLWYENPATSPIGRGEIFDTGLNSLTPLSRTFYVTDNYLGCESNPTAVDIQVTPVPAINLTIPPQCENREGVFSYSTPGPSVRSYLWTFGDNSSPETTQTVHHTYTSQGVYNLRLAIEFEYPNDQICPAEYSTTVTVGTNPIPTFTYSQLCEGDQTQFSGDANIAVERYEWDFGDGDVIAPGNSNSTVPAPNFGTYKNPRHIFPGNGGYDVVVRAYTNLGCFDSLRKRVTVLPYLTFDSSSPYSMAELDNGAGFWTTQDEKGDSTWFFATPQKSIINLPFKAWTTDSISHYKPGVEAYVNSPCFDIDGFARPVISVNYISNTQKGFDGAVLEYSTNGGVSWNPLGGPGSGLEWFNQTGFISGTIGASSVGWSGDLWAESDDGTVSWLEARRALDIIPAGNRSKVRFRVAFASSPDGEAEGFAFNNVKIEDRNRIVLYENFTNTNAPSYTINNDAFKDLDMSEGVKIQYHLSYPQQDEINRVNAVDPSARAAFYGLTNVAQLIPRAYVDGHSAGSFVDAWFANHAQLRSLKASPFEISINSHASSHGALAVSATVTALQNFESGKPVLHMAIVEKTVGNNEYVLRKLLPSPVGTRLSLPLMQGNIINSAVYDWAVSNTQIDPGNLAIIAFIQDEESREIHQAMILENPAHLPSVITDVEPSLLNQITYNNPVKGELHIRLPAAAQRHIDVTLIDSFGKRVFASSFPAGEKVKSFLVDELAAGVYFLQFNYSDNTVARKKVLVVR